MKPNDIARTARKIAFVAIILGRQYERAMIARDFSTAMAVEAAEKVLYAEYPEYFINTFLVEGRNSIRKRNEREPVYV